MTGSNWNKTGMAPSTKLPHHAQKATPWQTTEQPETIGIKFIYSEKATIFCKIFTLLLSYVVPVKNKVKILQNFVAFSEYNDFNRMIFLLVVEGFSYLLRNRRGQEKNIGPGKFADMNKCRALTDKNIIIDELPQW